jgi:cyclic beta-1,2-glucan synthetase
VTITLPWTTPSPPRRRRPALSRAAAAEALLAGPIRGELLGAERLAERARAIARAQTLRPAGDGERRTPLLAPLDETRGILADARGRLAAAGDAGTDVSPAGEWLLDDFHVVDEHIREVRESLPRSYYGELRELASGAPAGYPGVYEVAVTLIGDTEARIDQANVDLFVDAFQEVAPLAIGEVDVPRGARGDPRLREAG